MWVGCRWKGQAYPNCHTARGPVIPFLQLRLCDFRGSTVIAGWGGAIIIHTMTISTRGANGKRKRGKEKEIRTVL